MDCTIKAYLLIYYFRGCKVQARICSMLRNQPALCCPYVREALSASVQLMWSRTWGQIHTVVSPLHLQAVSEVCLYGLWSYTEEAKYPVLALHLSFLPSESI